MALRWNHPLCMQHVSPDPSRPDDGAGIFDPVHGKTGAARRDRRSPDDAIHACPLRGTDRPKRPAFERPAMPACAEESCDRPVVVRLYDPRGEDRDVCAAHARALAQRPGAVAEPLPDADGEWP